MCKQGVYETERKHLSNNSKAAPVIERRVGLEFLQGVTQLRRGTGMSNKSLDEKINVGHPYKTIVVESISRAQTTAQATLSAQAFRSIKRMVLGDDAAGGATPRSVSSTAPTRNRQATRRVITGVVLSRNEHHVQPKTAGKAHACNLTHEAVKSLRSRAALGKRSNSDL